MIRSHTHTPPPEGEALEIAPGVLWLQMPLPFKPDAVNVYALRDADGWTVVDTGLDTRRGRALWEGILAGPLAGAPVTRLIATHHHIDHIGLAGWFKDRGAELWTSRTAWLMARMGALDVQERPTPQALAFWRAAGMPPEQALDLLYRIDDELVPVRRFLRALAPALVSRVKVLGAMNLAEHRKPQDGRCTFTLDDGRAIEMTHSWYRGDAYDFVAELNAS